MTPHDSERIIPKKSQNDGATQKKRVALIGSSGGGTATLGHDNTSDFVRLISDHLNSIGSSGSTKASLDTVLFVSLNNGAGLDSVSGEENATLFVMQDGGGPSQYHDTLDRINKRVQDHFEAKTASEIEEGRIDGLICVSCKPSLFSRTLLAAAKRRIPVTGTGGSSLAQATTEFNVRLVGNSGGSVGTTPETKAISFASALSKDWNLEYSPWKSKRAKPPSWKSVLNSCLPGFWSIALFKRLIFTSPIGKFLHHDDDRERLVSLVFIIESYALPMLCAVVMATSRRKVETVQMSAVLAASACYKTVVGGLLAGWLVAYLEEQLLYTSILYWKIPATFTNLITGGLVGVFTAAMMTPISPYLRAMTEAFRNLSTTYVWNFNGIYVRSDIPLILSSVLGFLFCYGSKIGWYHSIFLPMILIEMELGDPSMLGALDMLTLVLVCAGVCLGILLTGPQSERSLAKRGMTINLLYGDFIEACYPHMEKYPLVNISGYLASSLSAMMISGSSCMSSAYLPIPIALWLADDRGTLLAASMVAFFIPFIGTVINYFIKIRNKKND